MVDALPLGPLDGPSPEILDPRFRPLVDPELRAERLWTGGRWTEGPAWLASSRTLVCSDIPNNRMLAWDETTGETRIFRQPSNGANGNTVDREGRFVTCEQYARRITRTEPDGTLIGKLRLPERAANLTFGGRGGGRLLITGSTSIYACDVRSSSVERP